MPTRPMQFVDLDQAGRTCTYVPLPGGMAMMAVHCDPSRGDAPFDGDEDTRLRQAGFSKVDERLHVTFASDAAGASLRMLYPRSKAVAFDEARHVRTALPASGGADAVDFTLGVGIDLVLAAAADMAAQAVAMRHRSAFGISALRDHAGIYARMAETVEAMAEMRQDRLLDDEAAFSASR